MEISPSNLKQKLDAGAEKLVLLDCREPWEHATAAIPNSELIPMNTIPQQIQHIEDLADGASSIIVYCHHGVRSLMVVNWLREQGVANCLSLAGGIDRWSIEVDASTPRY